MQAVSGTSSSVQEQVTGDTSRTATRNTASAETTASADAEEIPAEGERSSPDDSRDSRDEPPPPPMLYLSTLNADETADGNTAVTLQWDLVDAAAADRVHMFELCMRQEETAADALEWHRVAMIERGQGGRMSCTLGNLETGGKYRFGLRVLDVNWRRSPFAVVHT